MSFLSRLAVLVCAFGVMLGQVSPAMAQSPQPAQQTAAGEAQLWQQAVAAMRAGKPEQAVPLLDRLVSDHPQTARYRLELGFALFQTGQMGRAKYHVDLASYGNLTAQEGQAARNLMGMINEKRVWSGYFQLNIQPESNPGRQTDANTTDILGFRFVLKNNAKAQPSTSVILAAGLSYAPSLGQGLALHMRADLWSRQNEDDRLRDDLLSFRIGPRWTMDNGATLEAGLSYGRAWNAGKPLSVSTGAYLSYGKRLGGRAYGGVQVSWASVDKLDNTPDEIDQSLRLIYNRALSDRVTLRSNLTLSDKQASNPMTAYQEASLGIGALVLWPGGVQFQADLTAAERTYGGIDRLYLVTRQDQRLRLDMGLLDRDFRIGPFVPELRVGIERGTSNIALYDYENKFVTVRFTRQF